jgi:CRP/FNR family transcriptional regulator
MSASQVLAPDRRLWVLRNFDLFKSLSANELTILAQESRLVEFGRNNHICMSGVKHTHAYLIKEGNVRIVSTNAQGKRLTVGILKPGELIGDIDLFENELVFGESAEAIGKCVLYAVPLETLKNLILSKAEMVFAVSKLVGERRSQIINQMQDVLFLTVPQRLAKLVQRLAKEFPGETKSGRQFVNIKLTHAELADLIGSNCEAVSATIAKWKANGGPIDVVKGFIVIRDSEGLIEFAAA